MYMYISEFFCRKRFADSANQVVVSRLVKEVKALSNGEASGVQIIGKYSSNNCLLNY